jgi:hypothetical protein
MKGFANWVMKGRMQAVTAATVLAILALIVTPLALLSAAIVIMTVRRQGWQEGAIVIGTGMAAMAALGALLLQMPLAAALVGAMLWLPAALFGAVLGQTRSLRAVIEMAGLGAVGLVLLQHGLMADPAAFWTNFLNEFLTQRVDAETVAATDLGTLVPMMAGWMPGGVAATWLIGAVLSIAIALRLLDLLDGSEDGRRAFRELRLSRWLLFVVPALLVFVLIDKGAPSLVGHVYLVGMVLFLVQGVAMVHGIVAIYGASVAWIVGLYFLLIFVAPQGATVIAAAGYADGWVDFRSKAQARRGPGNGPGHEQ